MYKNASVTTTFLKPLQNHRCQCRCRRFLSSLSSPTPQPTLTPEPQGLKHKAIDPRLPEILYKLLRDPKKASLSVGREKYVPIEDVLSHPHLQSTSVLTLEDIARSDPLRRFHLLSEVRPHLRGGVSGTWIKARGGEESITRTELSLQRIKFAHQFYHDPVVIVSGDEYDFVVKNGVPEPEHKSYIKIYEQVPQLDLRDFPPRETPHTRIYITLDLLHLTRENVKMYRLDDKTVLAMRQEEGVRVLEGIAFVPDGVELVEEEVFQKAEAEVDRELVEEARAVLDADEDGAMFTSSSASPQRGGLVDEGASSRSGAEETSSISPPVESQTTFPPVVDNALVEEAKDIQAKDASASSSQYIEDASSSTSNPAEAPAPTSPLPIPRSVKIILPPHILTNTTTCTRSKITISARSLPFTPSVSQSKYRDAQAWARGVWSEEGKDGLGVGVYLEMVRRMREGKGAGERREWKARRDEGGEGREVD